MLTYLNCYTTHERAANVHCPVLAIKGHVTCHFPSITNLDIFRSSALPCRSTKCQQYPRTHLKSTQHLWKKTKPDKMLPNWPVFRELQLAAPSREHELLTDWRTYICTKGEKRRYKLQKQRDESQEEASREKNAQECKLLTNTGVISQPHKLLMFKQKFCSAKPKMPLG